MGNGSGVGGRAGEGAGRGQVEGVSHSLEAKNTMPAEKGREKRVKVGC